MILARLLENCEQVFFATFQPVRGHETWLRLGSTAGVLADRSPVSPRDWNDEYDSPLPPAPEGVQVGLVVTETSAC